MSNINISQDLKRHAKEFIGYLRGLKYERSPTGLYFPAAQAEIRGEYVHDVNGQDERIDPNLIVDQGLTHMLSVEFGSATQITSWYLSLFAGSVVPAANLTAANYASTQSEITSSVEGYSETTRQAFTPGSAAAAAIDNLAAKAAFTIVTASQLNVTGAALLSNNVKGSTAGVLASASKFSSTRVLSNTDVFNCGYRVTLTST